MADIRLTRKDRDKVAILSRLYSVAEEYKNNMVGNIFMYVFDNRFIEVNYQSINFKHLTGVASRLTPNQFYQNCINKTLSVNQIDFTPRHPYDLADKKLTHLMNLYHAATCESFMLEDVSTSSGDYKFGTTELSFSILLTEDKDDATGLKRSDYYVTKSLRHEDCFNKASNCHSITHIFVKRNDEDKYSKILFCMKSANKAIPSEAFEKFSNSLKNEILK